MLDAGRDYPYDPVVYYNFHTSINFGDPIIMDDNLCEEFAKTANGKCKFCVNHYINETDRASFDSNFNTERPECLEVNG